RPMGDELEEPLDRWRPRRSWMQSTAGQIVLGAAVLALGGLGIWTAVQGFQTRPSASAPPPEAVVLPAQLTLAGPIRTIVEGLPDDTTAIAALRAGDLLAAGLVPLAEPGFERLARIVDGVRACGADPKQVALVVFVQRVHHLESQSTGDPGDAHNVMFL